MLVRVVLDTDVMVAAFRSAHGASRRCLRLGLDRRMTLLLSTPLLFEYEAVLTRPQHLAASGASAEEVAVVLDDLAASSDWVRLDFLWRPLLRDADDLLSLHALREDAAVRERATSKDRVELLWQVCAIPDFAKDMHDSHARLLSQIYLHLCDRNGRLPSDWVAGQLRNIDRTHRNQIPALCRAVKGLERRGLIHMVKQAPEGWRREIWLLFPVRR